MTEPPRCLPPKPLAAPPETRLPKGTCDCHFHVFTEASALSPARTYTPPRVTVGDWLALADSLGVDRGVLVQPSVYGTDNGALLEALAAAPGRLRGVVVIPADTPEAGIAALDRAGVRGVRINLLNTSGLPIEAAGGLARRIARFGWHLQFQVGPDQIDRVARIAREDIVPVVVDHLAFIPVAAPRAGADLAALQRLLDTGRAHVKVSAPYRIGPAADFARAAGRLAASHPERLLWGSDWPHSDIFADMPDDGDLVAGMLATFTAPDLRRRVLVDNPARLYWA